MKFGLPQNKLLTSSNKGCCEAGLNAMTCKHETHQADLHQSWMFEVQDCGEELSKEWLGVSWARKLNLETDNQFFASWGKQEHFQQQLSHFSSVKHFSAFCEDQFYTKHNLQDRNCSAELT